jgi:hypothetical protein
MTSESKAIWILNQQIKLKHDRIKSLKQELKLEKICSRIDRILDKKECMRQFNASMTMTDRLIQYMDLNPPDSSDETTEFKSDIDMDDAGRDQLFTIDEFIEVYNRWCPDEIKYYRETFNI